jgi:putative ABC transport system ATP-binding protein
LRGGQIGLVFQRPQLLASRSAIDNVALPLLYRGLPGRRRRLIAADLLDRLGVAGQADTQAGRLSDGERQLVAIARALAGGPSLLLCDEPTAGLDASCAAQVAELLIGLHADGVTVAAVTGDPLIAAHGTQRIALGHRQHADLRPGAGR